VEIRNPVAPKKVAEMFGVIERPEGLDVVVEAELVVSKSLLTLMRSIGN
jgi:hypothetical protein